MSAKAKRDHVKAAAVAHSDLNIFYAVIALMESSLVSAACFRAEGRIVQICKDEAQKCLRRYDKNFDAALSSTPGQDAGKTDGGAS